MISLKSAIKKQKVEFHDLYTLADGEKVLHCKCDHLAVRVNEKSVDLLDKLGGTRVLLENGFGDKWVMTVDEIRQEPDKVDGPHGPFWGIRPTEETPAPVDIKQRFGSTNPQLRTIQDKLQDGETFVITKTGATVNAAPAV